jgi:hypothetical protein
LVLNSIQFVFKLMPTVAKMQFSFLIFLKNKGNALVSHFKPLRLMLKNMLSLGLFGDSSFVSNKKHKKTFPSQETVPNSRTICRADYFFLWGRSWLNLVIRFDIFYSGAIKYSLFKDLTFALWVIADIVGTTFYWARRSTWKDFNNLTYFVSVYTIEANTVNK